jgi:hypothetical protein
MKVTVSVKELVTAIKSKMAIAESHNKAKSAEFEASLKDWKVEAIVRLGSAITRVKAAKAYRDVTSFYSVNLPSRPDRPEVLASAIDTIFHGSRYSTPSTQARVKSSFVSTIIVVVLQ